MKIPDCLPFRHENDLEKQDRPVFIHGGAWEKQRRLLYTHEGATEIFLEQLCTREKCPAKHNCGKFVRRNRTIVDDCSIEQCNVGSIRGK